MEIDINELDLSIYKALMPIPENKKRLPHHPFIAFDTENNPKDGKFICGGLFGQLKRNKKGKIEFITTIDGKIGFTTEFEKAIGYYADSIEDFLRALRELGKHNTRFGAYNLSYDEFCLHDIIDDSKTLRVGSRVILMQTYEKKEIWDIQNVSGIEFSLEEWIELLDMKNKYGVQKESLDDLNKRVMSDAKATWILINFVEDFFVHEIGSKLKMTIGSCALELFRRKFLKQWIIRKFNDELDNFERESYKGGRVEVFKRGNIEVSSYDVNSMYLSILRDNEFPIPNDKNCVFIKSKQEIDGLNKKWNHYYDNYLCIIDALIFVPFQIIAPLPYKDENEKTIYPTGTIRGVYTNVELKNAEKYGVRILEVYRMSYYTQKEKLFKDFANFVWSKRLDYKSECANKCIECLGKNHCVKFVKNPKQNKAMDIMIKKIGNSLYGKTGEKRNLWSYYGKESDIPDDILLKINEDKCHIEPKDINGELYISYTSKEFKDTTHTFTCIASFVTAYARIKLLNFMKQFESTVVYCDTDSIKLIVNTGKYESSKDLGNLGYEYTKFENFYAPKNYGNKIKGIPKNTKRNPNRNTMLIDDKINGKRLYRYENPIKFRQSLRSKHYVCSQWVTMEKNVLMNDDKRIWFGFKFYNQGIKSVPYKFVNNVRSDRYDMDIGD